MTDLLQSLQVLPHWFLTLMLILLSACIGSFLNVVIYRLPLILEEKSNLTLWRPRSFCPRCHHLIHCFENIPLLSFTFLKGKCRHCRAKISLRYPFVEMLTILLSLITYKILGLNTQMFAGLLFTWCVIAMTFIDIDHFLLPDQCTLGLLWLGLLLNVNALFTPLANAVLGAALAYLILWAINSLYHLIRKKDGLGQGDWKLLATFGAWFGFVPIFYILAGAAILGTIYGGTAILFKRAKLETAVPFGPFLCIAGWGWLLWGHV